MKKIIALASLFSLTLLVSVATHAEIYKWVDKNGRVHYTATPPPPKNVKVKAKNIEDDIRAKAGKYRPPAKNTQASNDTAPNTNPELAAKQDLKLAGPDQKLIKYCNSQRNNLQQLQKNYRNVWVDIKGKKTNLSQEQRKEKVMALSKTIAEDCAGVKAQ